MTHPNSEHGKMVKQQITSTSVLVHLPILPHKYVLVFGREIARLVDELMSVPLKSPFSLMESKSSRALPLSRSLV